MPAPSPSMTAMTEAKAGRSSGAASAVSRIWPTMTPISAPTSVAAIAASERKSSVSSTIAIATPMSSPTGASCSEARSIRMPRASTSTPSPSRGLRGGDAAPRRRPSRGRPGRSCSGRRPRRGGRPRETCAPSANGSPTWTRRPRCSPTFASAPSIAGSVILERAVVDAEDDRRVGAGEGGAVRAEEIERLLGLRARDLEVVGRLAARAGGGAEQHDHDDRGGEAALPVMGERAREAREEQGHADLREPETYDGEARNLPGRGAADSAVNPTQAPGSRRARCPQGDSSAASRPMPRAPGRAGARRSATCGAGARPAGGRAGRRAARSAASRPPRPARRRARPPRAPRAPAPSRRRAPRRGSGRAARAPAGRSRCPRTGPRAESSA